MAQLRLERQNTISPWTTPEICWMMWQCSKNAKVDQEGRLYGSSKALQPG
jgi:hypothetical protein